MNRFLPKHKGVLALLLTLFAGMGTAYAYSFSKVCSTGQTLYYNITDASQHYVEIVYPGTSNSPWGGYIRPSGNITLPSSVSYNGVTYTVKAIGEYAFWSCWGLTGSLTIPNSVTSIGDEAFYDCDGFTGSLTIGTGVTSIGSSAFSDCTGFTQVKYNAINCADVTDEDKPFKGCGGTLTIGSGVQHIPAYMFYNCTGFTGSLTIPNSVTSIGECAFLFCSGFTGSLTIPNPVTSIGGAAFASCYGITQVKFNAINCADAPFGHAPFGDCVVTLTIGSGVQRIPAYMFCGADFTGSLTIPNSVTSIGDGAFYDCNGFTGSLTIPSSVTSIGNAAFAGCSGFTGSLTIPNSVTTIGNAAFRSCHGFTGNLTIGNSVTSIGNEAFLYCPGFTGNLTIGNSVTSIGDEAFWNCEGFTGSLTIPNSVTTIGDDAFENCSGFTGTLTIPNSVTSIGNGAFCDCNGFTQVQYNATNCADVTSSDTPFVYCGGTLTIGNDVQRIPAYMFDGAGFTGTLTIGTGVTSIGTSAFKNCTGFTHLNYNAVNCANVTNETKPFEGWTATTLTIGSGVQHIPAYMFYNCTGFTGTLTIPNSVTTIGNYAFQGCGFTGNLTIGNSVTSIGYYAFEGCNQLSSMTALPETPPSVSSFTFSGIPNTIPIYVPCGSLSAYQNATGWNAFTNIQDACGLLTYSINPDGVSVTVTGHVDGTDAIGALIIPATTTINGVTYIVTKIGDNAFYGCSGLTGTPSIPNSVISIGNYAFYNCSGFTGSLTLPSSLTEIGNYAFYNCFRFTGSLTIPNSVTMIGSSSFRGCSGFTGSLTIPNSVTSIGNYAFCNTGFTGSLSIGNSVTVIGGAAFYNCGGFTGSLILPSSVTTIGDYAFQYCSGFTGSLTIPGSVTRIGNYAFRWCEGLTGSLTIGNSVTWIGNEAFAYCSNLTSMTLLPETPPTMGTDVFYNVPTTIPVYVPCSALEDYQATLQLIEFNIQCREMLTVYDGTSTSYYIPAYIYYFDEFTKSQFVIPAYDLEDMVGTSISSMSFYTDSYHIPYTTESSADVYLKEVSYTTINAYEPKASATTVYSGYFDIVSTGNGGEMTINFNTPYTYNGGNLLVGIENTEDNGWEDIVFYGKTVNGASVSGSSDISLGNVQPEQQNFIPKTTFGYTPSACSRPIALTATGITSNSAMLNWTGFQDEYDVRYRTKPLFFEGFENGLPSDWTTIDNDGDGYNWYHYSNSVYNYAHSGTHLMGSASWQEGTALTPDNWLVTPLLQLQGTMKVWLSANSSTYQDEHFAIYLSTTDNSVSDFTTVLVPETVTSSEYVCYTADLSAYAGQQGYIAIRHFNCTDMDRLRLDDFGIYDDLNADEWELALSTDNQLFIENLASNTEYEWQVRGRDCDGSGTFTSWSAACSFTTKCEAFIVDAGNPFTEDFEGTDFAPDCWENIPSGIFYHWSSSTGQSHSSSHSAYSGWYGDIYLVLPDLELSANASSVQLSFWSYNSYPSYFEVGNNTVVLLNGGTETVLWSAETVSQEWVETIVDLTAYLGQTVSLAFKYAGYNGNGWYVDDVEVSASTNITQTSPLSAGTNWFSTYVDITLEDL